MGLWVNLGFLTFVFLLVFSGHIRADEKPIFTPYSVCPLTQYQAVSSESEFVGTENTLYFPNILKFQAFYHPKSVRMASAFMIEHTESKRSILTNNRRQIAVLSGCLAANSAACTDPKMRELIERYMSVDFKKSLSLFRVMEALAFRANYEDVYSNSAYWYLEGQINYRFEGQPGWGLLRAHQEPMTAQEREMAEGFYFEFWSKFALEVEQYLTSELARSETDKYRAHKINQGLSAIKAARLHTDKTELIRAVSFIDMPGWEVTLQERVYAFRQQMRETWFNTFNAFRIFAYVAEANPTVAQMVVALAKMDSQAQEEHFELGKKIDRFRQARSAGGSLFSLNDEPMSLLQHTLAKNNDHCRIASNLYHLTSRREQQLTVIKGGILIASFWLPQQVVIPLFIGIGGYSAYSSNMKFVSERDIYLSFLSEGDSFQSKDQMVFAMTEKLFDEIMLPLYLFGLPNSVRGAKQFLVR